VTPRAEQLQAPGAEVLRLLSYRSVRALPQLADRRRRPSRIEVPSSTFHRHAPELLRLGAITRRVAPGPPRQVVYGLGASGVELCELIIAWQPILQAATPGVPDDDLDWEVPRRFARGWAAGIFAGLLDGPRSVREVEAIVRPARPRLTPHQIGGLLNVLIQHRFLELVGEGYGITELGRLAIGELAASVRFERLHMGADAVPVTAEDGANALRATLPLISLLDHPGGICEFVVRGDPDGPGSPVAIAWVEVKDGRVVATGIGNAPRPSVTWAQGTIDQWLAAVLDHRPRTMKAAGERSLSKSVVDQLHTALYGDD
jgi:hypothetical protein